MDAAYTSTSTASSSIGGVAFPINSRQIGEP